MAIEKAKLIAHINHWFYVSNDLHVRYAHELGLFLHGIYRVIYASSLYVIEPIDSIQLNHFGIQSFVRMSSRLHLIKINFE